MPRSRECQDAEGNIHWVNHATDAALVMQVITQAQFPQAPSPLDLSHPSGCQSFSAGPSYTATTLQGSREARGKKEKMTQKSLKEISARRGGKKKLEGIILFPATSLTSF